MKRFVLFLGLTVAVGAAVLAALVGGRASASQSALPAPHPTLSDYVQMTASETPPSQMQCNSVGRRCFNPASTRASYNLNPLYGAGLDGHGITIAIVDSYGSDTIAHDLHVYDHAWGLPPMCGEEGFTGSACTPAMPTFSQLAIQGSPATKAPPGTSNGNGLQDKAAWALEVSLDVETAHSIAPGANILLVTTPVAETLGVQGFQQMMNAEDYVVKSHLAQVISQSFSSAELAFPSAKALLNLRGAFTDAAQNGVTVLAASGDDGSAGFTKQSLLVHTKQDTLIPVPTVGWPASDPLVTGVGGTYLCTDATNGTSVDTLSPPGNCQGQTNREIGWIAGGGGFSSVFSRPAYQSTLPAGSTSIPSTQRGVPDVALQASSRTGALVYLTLPPDGDSGLLCGSTPCSTGWYDIGGTSLSTPQWAGIVAIADQLKGHGLGLINNALYALANGPTYAADFYDVTTGNNGANAPDVPGYSATPGWDPVTGLGTPNAANLVPDLVAATP
jgi:subtilase family serine protease